LALVPATAGAAVREGSGTDPSGDGPTPARDVTAVKASYDDGAGTLTFAVTFAAAPDDVFLSGFVGSRQSDGTCSVAAGVGGDSSGVAWLFGSASGSDGTRSVSGTTVALSATAPSPLSTSPPCQRRRPRPRRPLRHSPGRSRRSRHRSLLLDDTNFYKDE
jgi:hypothetical protein